MKPKWGEGGYKTKKEIEREQKAMLKKKDMEVLTMQKRIKLLEAGMLLLIENASGHKFHSLEESMTLLGRV